MKSVLEDICSSVLRREKGLPPVKPVRRNPPADVAGMMRRDFFLIAEIKHRSPSRGVIVEGLDPVTMAANYCRGGASAVSVVTEEEFFGGSLNHLISVRKSTGLPLLRKDFIVTPRQVVESYNSGADMLLLIVACLAPDALVRLIGATVDLGMTPLVEVHTGEELNTALEAGAGLIGINNRDLSDFSVDFGRSIELMRSVPDGISVISESGIGSREQIRVLRETGFAGALVGQSLLESPDPELAVRRLLS